MNYYKANMEVSKALSKGEPVRGYEVSKDLFFATADGYYGFVIPYKEIVFDINRIHICKPVFNPEDFIKPENEIKKTNYFFLAGREYCRKFEGNLYNVYIKQKFLNALDGEIVRGYYQNVDKKKNMSKELVVATVDTRIGNEITQIPVMAFCPISILAYDM